MGKNYAVNFPLRARPHVEPCIGPCARPEHAPSRSLSLAHMCWPCVRAVAGMDDTAYESIFKPVLAKAFEMFQPSAVVLCCGADSLSGDRVGCWNLSIKG